MADAERGSEHKKKIAKSNKGRPKSHWKKHANFINIGNKDKGHAFAEKRKKIALQEYKKLLKKTREEHKQRQSLQSLDQPPQTHPSRVSETSASREQDKTSHLGYSERHSQGERQRKTTQHKRKSVNKFTTAENEFKKRKLEKEQQIKEREVMIQKHREEVREKMKKRRETFGRLNRRTRKGQPIMANQIEHLLDKIQAKR